MQISMKVLVTWIIGLRFASCGHVLVWNSLSSRSHYILFEPIMHELARRGHQVTAIAPYETKAEFMGHPNVTYVVVDTVKYMKESDTVAEKMFHGDAGIDVEIFGIMAKTAIKVRRIIR